MRALPAHDNTHARAGVERPSCLLSGPTLPSSIAPRSAFPPASCPALAPPHPHGDPEEVLLPLAGSSRPPLLQLLPLGLHRSRALPLLQARCTAGTLSSLRSCCSPSAASTTGNHPRGSADAPCPPAPGPCTAPVPPPALAACFSSFSISLASLASRRCRWAPARATNSAPGRQEYEQVRLK